MASTADLVARIRAAGKKPDFYGPQLSESVDQLENLLGVTLPPSYRQFLLQYGGGYGLIGLYGDQPDSLELGCLWGDTQRLREKYQLPSNFIPIQISSLGGIYALDTRASDDAGECPVILITIGPEERLTHRVRAADSFGSYLHELLENRLAILLEEQEDEAI